MNFAQTLGVLGVPVLVQQIGGGGADEVTDCDVPGGQLHLHTTDKVVPNAVEGAPLAGTTPLATLLGAAPITEAPTAAAPMNALMNLTIGHHGSLLRPNECGDEGAVPTKLERLATAELQTEVVSFVADPSATAVGTAGEGAAANFIQAP